MTRSHNAAHTAGTSVPFKKMFLRTRALTLVELLVIVVVIGILIAIIFPTVKSLIGEARKVKCAGNLRSISVMLIRYVGEQNGAFPLNYDPRRPLTDGRWEQRIFLGEKIEPHLFRCPNVHNHRNVGTPEAYNWYYYFAAFGSTSYGLSDWLARLPTDREPGTSISSVPVTRLQQIQKPARTVMLSERGSILLSPSRAGRVKNAIPWFGLPKHGSGVNVVFVDGHMEFIEGVESPTHWKSKLDDDIWWNPNP